jgi:hypothetical protein
MAAEDNLSSQQFFHMSPKENRESIEADGLLPSKRYESTRKGVYFMPDAPNTAYGDDVYKLKPDSKTEIHLDNEDPGAVYSRKKIPTKNFERVGHVFKHPKLKSNYNILGEEVHWHKEEDCPEK